MSELAKLKVVCAAHTRERALAEVDVRLHLRIGCVYFIECGGFVKIGYTYDLKARMIELQIGNPAQLILIRTINTDRPAGLEAELHNKFADARRRG